MAETFWVPETFLVAENTEKSIAFPDPMMCIEVTTIQNLFKQHDTSDFPNLKSID